MLINNYDDFIIALLKSGFSSATSNKEEIFSLANYFSPEEIQWHTENKKTDPWTWRIRVLEERNDIAYAKLFYKKNGYLTSEWYPYFLSARRKGQTFTEAYQDGTISNEAKRIYQVVTEHEQLPLHLIKKQAGFSKEEKSRFDRGLTELQMQMFITMCGNQFKQSQMGQEYGWSSTVFCTTEFFWGSQIIEKAMMLDMQAAIERITQHILELNPQAKEKNIKKFILGK